MPRPLRDRPVRTLPSTVVAATTRPVRVGDVVTATYDTSRRGVVEHVDTDNGGAVVRWVDSLCGWAPRSMLALVSP